MGKQIQWVMDRWVILAGSLAVTLLLTLMLGFRIGALTQGTSLPEKQYIQSNDSGSKIAYNPVFLAHKTPTYVLGKLKVNRIGIYRAISAVFVVVAAASIFYILKSWYSLRIAILGTWLFVSSSWVLHLGRLALPEIVFILIIPFIAAVVWMKNTNRHSLGLITLSIIIGTSLYIPGFIWLTSVLLIWQRKALWQIFKVQSGLIQAVCSFLLMAGVLPMLLAAIHSPTNLLLPFGIPTEIPQLAELVLNAISIPKQLFLHGPNSPVLWLGGLPLLDAFSSVMVFLGIYSFRYHVSDIKTQLMAISTLVISLLIIIGSAPISALLPLVYIVIGGGVAFMLQQWFTVFPRNPIARGIATTLMSVAVLLVSFYHINHYFIAWPQTPTTKNAFSQKL